jgi:hypothetical protein
VGFDGHESTKQFVAKDAGPQEFFVTTELGSERTSDFTDVGAEWKRGHTGGGHPKGNNDSAFACGGATFQVEAEATLVEEVTGAVGGNGKEHDFGQVGHEVPVFTGTDGAGGEEDGAVEVQCAQIHDALQWQKFRDVFGDQVPDVEISFRDVVVDDVPQEDDHRHVGPDAPVSDRCSGQPGGHHTATKGIEDAANDVVCPVSTVGTDGIN